MTEPKQKKKRSLHNAARAAVLVTILLVITASGILHQIAPSWRPVGVDALCPFGGVESLVTVFLTGKMLERIALSSFILLAAGVITALVFRRGFCGYICPLGTLQDLSRMVGRVFVPRKLAVPAAVDRPARWLKYVVLFAVVAFSVALGKLVIRPYDPWVAWQHLSSDEVIAEFGVGLAVLVLSLVGSAVFERVFCKYLCPMGAFLGILSKIGYFRVKRNEKTCIDCSACTKACPVGIPVADLTEVKTAECISCNLCVTSCPVKDTLNQQGRGKGVLPPVRMLLAVLGIFALVVGITTVTGDFSWTVKSIERHAEEKGAFNPADIKGSDTFKAVSKVSGVPKEAFMEKFKLTEKEWDGTLRDWAHKPGSTFEVENVREFLKEKMEK